MLEQIKSNNIKTIDQKKQENEQIIADLIRMGVSEELAREEKPRLSRDNREVYSKIQGLDADDIKHLLKLDKDIERLFEVSMKKRNKNDEMVRNKINDLNEKPALRDLIFKQVSDQQLKKDIEVIIEENDRMYEMS